MMGVILGMGWCVYEEMRGCVIMRGMRCREYEIIGQRKLKAMRR